MGFVPPQSYAYDTKYQELVKSNLQKEKEKIILKDMTLLFYRQNSQEKGYYFFLHSW